MQKIVHWVRAKELAPEHKAKSMESALTNVVHLFLHHKKFLSDYRLQNDREAEMIVTLVTGFNSRLQIITEFANFA